jgi:hypothetical protein
VLDRLPADAHGVGPAVEAGLHGLDDHAGLLAGQHLRPEK